MRTIGTITAVVVSAAAVGALIIGVRSVPDVKRYLRMRSM
jgi:hypothetical protein